MSGIGRGEWQKQIVAKRGNRGNGGRSCEDNRTDACCRGEETRESVCVSYVRATRLDSRTVVPFPTSRLLGEREGEGRIYTPV